MYENILSLTNHQGNANLKSNDISPHAQRMKESESEVTHVWLFVISWTLAYQDPPAMGIFQVRALECVDISFSRGSSRSRHQIRVSHIVGRCFTILTTREVLPEGWLLPKIMIILTYPWRECNGAVPMKNNREITQKIKTRTTILSSHSISGFSSKYLKSGSWGDICTPIFTAALFTVKVLPQMNR